MGSGQSHVRGLRPSYRDGLFDDAYVLPITQIFDDIKRRLGANSVELPNDADLLHAITVSGEAERGCLQVSSSGLPSSSAGFPAQKYGFSTPQPEVPALEETLEEDWARDVLIE